MLSGPRLLGHTVYRIRALLFPVADVVVPADADHRDFRVQVRVDRFQVGLLVTPEIEVIIEQFSRSIAGLHTVCPRSSDPFYIVSRYIKRVTTSWTYSSFKKWNSLQCVDHSLIPLTKISSTLLHVQLLQFLHGKQQQHATMLKTGFI